MKAKSNIGHLAALLTVSIWAVTFVSTKVLLSGFKPVEILFFRFVMGFIALMIVYPHRLKVNDIKKELYFALAGLSGICLYYLLENLALNLTLVSNVGVIISVAPFFTAILTHLFMRGEEKLKINFFVGFITAITGICLISFESSAVQVNPLGDLLAVLAAVAWAIYSVLTRKISSFGYNTIQTTRRVFLYGIVFMIPALFLFEFNWDVTRFSNPVYLFNIIFLGIGASALCFVTWGFAVRVLGAVKTSIYIYLVPVITVVASVIVLRERITPIAMVGIALTLLGLVISQGRIIKRTR